MSRIDGSNVLITGAASGIGRLMAMNFAELGAHVVLWDIDDANLERVAGEIKKNGRLASAYHCNVAIRDEVKEVAEKVKKDTGQIHILINNAGVVSGKTFWDCSDEQLERSLAVNIQAHFWTVRAFLPDMIRSNRGHIVTIASAAGLVGVSRLVDYCASKFAAFGFDEALRMEIKQRKWNVKTTVVCPYFINTGMFNGTRTRFSWLLPILEESHVAGEIVQAVQKDKKRLLLPPILYAIWILRYLPVAVFDMVMNLLGVNSAMHGFKGRSETVPEES